MLLKIAITLNTLGTFLLNRVDLFPQIYQVKKKNLTNIIQTGIKCVNRYTNKNISGRSAFGFSGLAGSSLENSGLVLPLDIDLDITGIMIWF